MTALLLLLSAALLGAEPTGAAPAPHLPESGGKDGRVHLQLHGDALYGIGGQSFLGAQLNLTAGYAVWDAGRATGAFEFGTQLQYSNEPTWLAPWLRDVDVSGAGQRVQWVVTAGHGFHMGKRRRVYLGTHLYAGWNHWRSSYSLNYPSEGVSGSATVSRNHFVSGGQLTFGYRVARRVGLNLLIGAPFPTISSYVVGLAHAGLGLTVHLR